MHLYTVRSGRNQRVVLQIVLILRLRHRGGLGAKAGCHLRSRVWQLIVMRMCLVLSTKVHGEAIHLAWVLHSRWSQMGHRVGGGRQRGILHISWSVLEIGERHVEIEIIVEFLTGRSERTLELLRPGHGWLFHLSLFFRLCGLWGAVWGASSVLHFPALFVWELVQPIQPIQIQPKEQRKARWDPWWNKERREVGREERSRRKRGEYDIQESQVEFRVDTVHATVYFLVFFTSTLLYHRSILGSVY